MRFTEFLRDIGPYVTYHPRLNRITGSVTATIFLSALLAWEGSQRDPEGWIYKTREQMTEDTGLTRTEQDTARRHLVGAGLMAERRKGVPATMHYRLDLDAIDRAWDAANKNAETLQSSLQDSYKLKRRNPANKNAETLQTITEDTAETTSETTQGIVSPRANEEGLAENRAVRSPVDPMPRSVSQRSHASGQPDANPSSLAEIRGRSLTLEEQRRLLKGRKR